MRCEHSLLRADGGRGDDCPSIATWFGKVDGKVAMHICARHAAGWARTVTSGVGTVARRW